MPIAHIAQLYRRTLLVYLKISNEIRQAEDHEEPDAVDGRQSDDNLSESHKPPTRSVRDAQHRFSDHRQAAENGNEADNVQQR